MAITGMSVGSKKKSAKAPAGARCIDTVRVFAERVRDHKELESRWAVLQETRVEYFRGKDFVALLTAHPELRKLVSSDLAAADLQSHQLGDLLVHRKLIIRCDRVVKTVRTGKKKLSKWPARIELHPDQEFSEDDAFFAWTFERRRPLWQTVMSFLVPIVTVACCLFPVFPHWCKLLVLYLCLTFLGLIFGILFARWAVFSLLWIVLGKRIWFFPNILAEEATFSELFLFLPDASEDKDPPPKWTARLGFAVATAGIIWLVVHHAPDEAARTRYQKRVANKIDELLEWRPNTAALTGKSATTSVPEAIIVNNTGSDGNEPSGEPPEDSVTTCSPVVASEGEPGHDFADDSPPQTEVKGDDLAKQGPEDANAHKPNHEL